MTQIYIVFSSVHHIPWLMQRVHSEPNIYCCISAVRYGITKTNNVQLSNMKCSFQTLLLGLISETFMCNATHSNSCGPSVAAWGTDFLGKHND